MLNPDYSTRFRRFNHISKKLDIKLFQTIVFIEHNRFKYELEVNTTYRLKVQYTSVVKKIPVKEILC